MLQRANWAGDSVGAAIEGMDVDPSGFAVIASHQLLSCVDSFDCSGKFATICSSGGAVR